MGSDWKLMTLAEADVTLIDCVHKTPKEQDYGVPYIGIPQMKTGRIDFEADPRLISEEDYVSWTVKAKPQENDIVLSRRTNPGVTAPVKKMTKFALGQNLVLLRSIGETIYPPFLRWYVHSPLWWGNISRYLNVGAVFDSLRCGDVPYFTILVPPLNEQKSIAHILGTLDDKIELNRKMNETLEEMAQALFKSWFVDFDPVLDKALAAGHEIPEPLQAKAEKRKALGKKRKALPQAVADLFPDRFVFTEELGWVPEGWEVSKLNHIVNVVSEKVNPEDVSKNLIYVGLEHIDRKNIFLSKNGNIQDVSSTKSYFGTHDILFGKLRPYFHKVCIAPEKGICSTDILVFSPKHEDSFAYSILNLYQPKLIETVNMASTGTRMPRANQKDILAFQIPLPSQDLICQFDKIIFPNLLNGIENNKENQVLSDLRDSLLPKLISGGLRVPDVEKMVGNNF